MLVAGRVRTSVRLGSKKQPRFLVPYRPLAVAICAPQGRALAPTYLDSGARYCSPTGLPVFAGTSIYSASHAPGLGLTHTQELLSYLTRELLSWSDPMFPPLHQSAMQGDVEMLRRLLESGESPDTVDDQGVLGRTPLHFLCQEFCNTENHAACLKLLRDAGANLEAKDELGFTPLHCAVMNGSVRLVSLLVQSGVHLDVGAKHSYSTALHLAAGKTGRANCVEVLLAAGASQNLRDYHGRTPFGVALYYSIRRTWPLFLRAGAEIPTDNTDPYIVRVTNAGGWKKYAHQHLARVTLILAPTPLLPPELVRKVLEYWLHAGYY